MSLFPTRALSVCFAASIAAAGACGDGDDTPSDGGGTERDAGTDAGTDAGADAGSDAAVTADAGEDDDAGESACEGCEAVTVAFKTQSGDAAVDCEHPVSVGGHEVVFSDIRYYVSEVELLRADGTSTPLVLDTQTAAPGKPAYQGQQVALLDFEDGAGSCQNGDKFTNDVLVGRAKPGDYTGIAFTLGVPEALNHLNVTAVDAPLNVMSMYWFWLSGYMFTAIDFHTTAAVAMPDAAVPAPAYFNVHLGSAGCAGNPSQGTVSCTRKNRARITLNDFDATRDAVILDVADLVSGRDVSVSSDEVPGCMSDPDDADCSQILENLAVDPATGSPTTGAQKAFRVGVK